LKTERWFKKRSNGERRPVTRDMVVVVVVVIFSSSLLDWDYLPINTAFSRW
jgi:hypothetical protein